MLVTEQSLNWNRHPNSAGREGPRGSCGLSPLLLFHQSRGRRQGGAGL